MAVAMQGLKLKTKYEDLINLAVSDGLETYTIPQSKCTVFTKWLC